MTMTQAQMNVITDRLSNIDKRLIHIESLQERQLELLRSIANDKIDVESLKASLEQLNKVVNSIKDEVEA